MIGRREFLMGLLSGVAGAAASGSSAARQRAWRNHSVFDSTDQDAWEQAAAILARIRAPEFPGRTFEVTGYGAVGDGLKDSTEAFAKAIAACSAAGGGFVVVPPGLYLTGPIHLKSNVNLRLQRGATIRFSRDPKDYLPIVFTRWEGMELMNYSPLVYAFEQENVGISGEGTLDGQADCEHWWVWKGRVDCGWNKGGPDQSKARSLLCKMVASGTPVSSRRFGEGSYLRPMFIQPYRCRNVVIEGVTLRGSPMWQVHPVLSQNVTVRGLTVVADGPNTDGCDPESCRDVLIEDCYFSTGDDCIAIKSGRNNDGRRVAAPSENIVIQRCHMRDGHGGVTIGSEISGGVRNVFARECTMDSPRLRSAIKFKNNAQRGGRLENFYFREMEVGRVAEATIDVDFNYEEGAKGPFTPVLSHVQVVALNSGRSERALDLEGLPNSTVNDIEIENCTFQDVAQGNIVKYVKGLDLRNVRINGKTATG